MARSVNMAIIIGNLTRDPEMRYTPQGHAVTSFGVATNRSWVANGEKREETEFHNVVAWNKLAELCSQLLAKGTKVYIQGRLQTRTWDDKSGVKHYRTEIVADDMVILSSKTAAVSPGAGVAAEEVPPPSEETPLEEADKEAPKKKEKEKPEEGEKEATGSEDVPEDQIPF